MFFPCLHSLVKTEANVLGEFENKSVKTRDAVEGFHLLENSQTLPRFSPGYEGTGKTCFISFIK